MSLLAVWDFQRETSATKTHLQTSHGTPWLFLKIWPIFDHFGEIKLLALYHDLLQNEIYDHWFWPTWVQSYGATKCY